MTKYLSKEGLEKLEKELEDLKSQRKDIAARLKKAVSYGDLSENADYSQAKDDQSFLEGKILETEELLRTAEVLEHAKGGMIGMGSEVEVQCDGDKEKYTIVGSQEANLLENKISVESPLGKELMNQMEGGEIIVSTPEGKKKYKILKVK